MIGQQISDTISRVGSAYKELGPSTHNRSFLILISGVLFGAVFSLLVTWVVWSLDLFPYHVSQDWYMTLFTGLFSEHYNPFAASTTVALGLFAVRTWRRNLDAQEEQNFMDTLRSITPSNWWAFGISISLLALLRIALYVPVFETGVSESSMWDVAHLDEGFGESRTIRLLRWANESIEAVVSLTPMLLIIWILMGEAKLKWRDVPVRKVAATVASMSILSLIVSCIAHSALHILKTYVFPPFTIPFETSALPFVFHISIGVLVIAMLIPAQLLCLTVPFDSLMRETNASAPGSDEFD